MIGRLSGTLIEKQPNQVIVDVGGVGYQVTVPLSTFAELGDLNGPVTLLVHTHLREDQLQLYGFLTARERQLFEMLITVTGVGPSLALKILSGKPAEELLQAIRRGDVERLVGIPGIGKKTAERIIMELRDRLGELVPEGPAPVSVTGPGADVASALLNLGYERRDVDDVLSRSLRAHPGAGFEFLFRAALAELSAAAKGAPRAERKG
ncbi:MAG: Holliday junction branch migration protein RuvA [Acidobacteriota bacterium]|nr:Holliday junction branch migration protein RuvA [Acidobacteriota bacterium]